MVEEKGLMLENSSQGFLFLTGWVVIQEAGICFHINFVSSADKLRLVGTLNLPETYPIERMAS